MKAAVRSRYGGPEVLEIKEIPKPQPREKELLVRVHATTINRTDCGILTGQPFPIRFFSGLFTPKRITGTDFAGVVEAVGAKVHNYKVGDRIFGFNDNCLLSHADYLTIGVERAIAHIPEGVSFAQAAATPEGAHYALNFINKVPIKAGDRVMVNGASGAIGAARVQLLKPHGVIVTATGNAQSMDWLGSLGLEEVMDYTQRDFTKSGKTFDYVFDTVGKSSFGACKPLLRKGGAYISSELGPGNENLYLPLTTKFSGDYRVIFPFPHSINKNVEILRGLLQSGAFRPLIDCSYPFEQIREAFTFVASGRKTGNVILLVGPEERRE